MRGHGYLKSEVPREGKSWCKYTRTQYIDQTGASAQQNRKLNTNAFTFDCPFGSNIQGALPAAEMFCCMNARQEHTTGQGWMFHPMNRASRAGGRATEGVGQMSRPARRAEKIAHVSAFRNSKTCFRIQELRNLISDAPLFRWKPMAATAASQVSVRWTLLTPLGCCWGANIPRPCRTSFENAAKLEMSRRRRE
jgi:hypothetical protein